MSTLRTFANRPGISYDAAKTSVIFAEDMNLLKTLLEGMGVDLVDIVSGTLRIGGAFGSETGKLRGNGSICSASGFLIPGILEMALATHYVAASFNFQGYNGTTRQDLIKYINQGTANVGLNLVKNVGFGNDNPTAKAHLGAGSATANTAPLKFTAGTNLTTPENGAMEFDGSKLYITIGGTRREIALV